MDKPRMKWMGARGIASLVMSSVAAASTSTATSALLLALREPSSKDMANTMPAE